METQPMTESIPLPASTARKLALTAFNEADRLDDDGFGATSQRVEASAERVLDVATEEKGGQFVSIDRHIASTITAYGSLAPSRTARVFLEQYGVWG